MHNSLSYQANPFEQAPEPSSLLPSSPSFHSILFPDFENKEAPAAASSNDSAAEGFTIDNLSKASWAVSKILEADARIAQRTQLAKEFKSRIDAWLQSANSQDEDSISYLSFLLEPYAKNEISKLHNSKTLSLPTGTASFRKLPDRLDITDTPTALAYCEIEHPEAVIIKKELDKSVLKDLILKQAEPIPGIEAELGMDKLYVKPLKLQAPTIIEKDAA
jgi:phage host-nuclease inhibitor protein Gam